MMMMTIKLLSLVKLNLLISYKYYLFDNWKIKKEGPAVQTKFLLSVHGLKIFSLVV